MPIYEYACEKCESEFEVEQRITDAPLKTCPRCRSRRIKRLISNTSFVLKGGGWYSDLYSSPTGKPDAASASSDSAESAKPESTSESKSDGKPGSDKGSDSTAGGKSKGKGKGAKAAA
jgi:putative FmdB family regulatory protein